MALTLHGYRIPKDDATPTLRKQLTVKPFVPSVFVPSHAVPRYPVFHESADYLYVPKNFGLSRFGPPAVTTRDVPCTPAAHWEFRGAIRPAQQPVVDAYLQPVPKDGILSLATGGGKTVCALYIASQLRVPTLILVHNTFLRDQWEERIRSFLPHARMGRVQGDVVEVEGRDIVIAMLQSLALKDYPVETFKPIGLVIVDECHHIASEAFCRAIPKVTSKHMLGLSATPERKDRLMYVIEWLLGPILFKSDTSDIADDKVRVEVYRFQSEDPEFLEVILNSQGVMSVANMVNKLAAYPARNALLIDVITDVIRTSPQRQMLVLTDRVQHTKDILAGLPEDVRAQAAILAQTVKADQRAAFCAERKVLIATYAMCKEGFDVATLNTLLIATPRPDVDQIVGRILRVPKQGRVVDPLILDIVDPQFRGQFQARLALYKKRNYAVEMMALE